MTLILSLATPSFVVQVSDRRVAESTTGNLVDPNATKSISFANRLVFGYTGFARVNGQDTSHWLAKTLYHSTDKSTSGAVERVAKMAAEVVATMPEPRRLTVIGVGWAMPTPQEISPIIIRISNYHDAFGQTLRSPQRKFTIWHEYYKKPNYWGWSDAGVPLLQNEKSQMVRKLKQCFMKGTKPRAAITILVDVLRQVHKRTPASVSDNLLVAYLPPPDTNQKWLRIVGPSLSAPTVNETFVAPKEATFCYLRGSLKTAIQYGPHFVVPGSGVFSDFQHTFGLLPPPPG